MENWTIEEHRKELLDRINYQYRQIDGTLKFPNSEEGDFIKMVHCYLMKEKAEQPTN